jgi:hypothetical protein
MHWTDTYSYERDMEHRLRDRHGEAHHRRLRMSARRDVTRDWFGGIREGLGRSADLASSAAGGFLALFSGSGHQEQCC